MIFRVNILNFLPRYVVDDFGINIIVNRIAVTDFAVVFGVGKDFIYLFVGDIQSFFSSVCREPANLLPKRPPYNLENTS